MRCECDPVRLLPSSSGPKSNPQRRHLPVISESRAHAHTGTGRRTALRRAVPASHVKSRGPRYTLALQSNWANALDDVTVIATDTCPRGRDAEGRKRRWKATEGAALRGCVRGAPAEWGGERHAKTSVAATEQLPWGRELPSRDSRICGQALRPSDICKVLHERRTNQIEAFPSTKDHKGAPRQLRHSWRPCSPPFLSFAYVVYHLHPTGRNTKWSTFPLRGPAARRLGASNSHEIWQPAWKGSLGAA